MVYSKYDDIECDGNCDSCPLEEKEPFELDLRVTHDKDTGLVTFKVTSLGDPLPDNVPDEWIVRYDDPINVDAPPPWLTPLKYISIMSHLGIDWSETMRRLFDDQ